MLPSARPANTSARQGFPGDVDLDIVGYQSCDRQRSLTEGPGIESVHVECRSVRPHIGLGVHDVQAGTKDTSFRAHVTRRHNATADLSLLAQKEEAAPKKRGKPGVRGSGIGLAVYGGCLPLHVIMVIMLPITLIIMTRSVPGFGRRPRQGEPRRERSLGYVGRQWSRWGFTAAYP